MAFKNITLHSSIWQNNGLKYLLFPDEASLKSYILPAKPEQAQSVHKRVKHPATTSNNLQPGSSASAKKKAAWKAIPVSGWPPEWKSQFEKTRKGLIAWSYWDLGYDVNPGVEKDQKHEVRRKILQTLIRDLGHPAGTHTFWPMALYSGSQYLPDPEIFWSGLSFLGARGVILLGSPAASALLKDASLHAFAEMRINGQFVWLLQDINNISLQENSYSKILFFLRQVLRRFVRN